MKPANFVIAVFFISVLVFMAASESDAQLCGTFGVTFNVHDSALNQVKNAEVKIVMPAGKPIEGHSYLRPEHKFALNKDGEMELRLSEGLEITDEYKVVVSAPGFQTVEKMLTFPHCKWISYDVTMLKAGEKSALVTGTVTDQNNKPVRYAGINFLGADGAEHLVNSDQNGRYEIKLKPGDYGVEAKLMYHHITKVEKFTVPAGGEAALDLRMKTQNYDEDKQVIIQSVSAVISGTVTDPNGAVVEKASVTAIGVEDRRVVTETNGDGKFDLQLPRGRYNVEVASPGFRKAIILFSSLDKDEHVDLILEPGMVVNAPIISNDPSPIQACPIGEMPLVLPPGAGNLLSGTVRDRDKDPVSGVAVLVSSANGSSTEIRTGSDGKYALRLVAGNYTVQFTLNGFFKTRFLNYKHAGDKTLDVEINAAKQGCGCATVFRSCPTPYASGPGCYCSCDDLNGNGVYNAEVIDLAKKK